eukprot:CAMPEP_0198129002 /NCGR_PEP_ID=MMETSP1442-20131203/50646_1 /TAXON_ID= /ORGANISM="Craspedostauros australis, Strain CCMP3328" /LENGTH=269 /DNA_ID=CAMNT_0043789289 /DNA_START=262 /DNA_END=1071 /DNA_ORIENTATION=-
MKILIQNLQKRADLLPALLEKYEPDAALFQEVSLGNTDSSSSLSTLRKVANTRTGARSSTKYDSVSFTSKRGYGTAIYSLLAISNVHKVLSPYSEFGGFIVKKTIIATTLTAPDTVSSSSAQTEAAHAASHPQGTANDAQEIRFVSFHGYNGQPFCNSQKLVSHVVAVLQAMDKDDEKLGYCLPTIFAGDFNTWSADHFEQVCDAMDDHGFRSVYSWPYPGRQDQTPLDHAFARDGDEQRIDVVHCEHFASDSDHLGALMEISLTVAAA